MISATQIGTMTTSKTKRADEPALGWGPREITEQFHFWRGASGRRYVHTVYSLIDCPELAEGSYVLVRRQANGTRQAVRIDRAHATAPSLNLAEIRQRGAQLGADEVHVHLLAETAAAELMVASDLRASQFAELAAEPSQPATTH